MGLRKMATKEAPHAVYTYGDWTWSVLKVNQPSKTTNTPWVTWFCLVVTPMTGPGGDLGDTYVADVLNYGTLASCTDEFKKYLSGEK